MTEKWEVTVVYRQVKLTIGKQRFPVGPQWEEDDEAEWYADRLREAMESLTGGRNGNA